MLSGHPRCRATWLEFRHMLEGEGPRWRPSAPPTTTWSASLAVMARLVKAYADDDLVMSIEHVTWPSAPGYCRGLAQRDDRPPTAKPDARGGE